MFPYCSLAIMLSLYLLFSEYLFHNFFPFDQTSWFEEIRWACRISYHLSVPLTVIMYPTLLSTSKPVFIFLHKISSFLFTQRPHSSSSALSFCFISDSSLVYCSQPKANRQTKLYWLSFKNQNKTKCSLILFPHFLPAIVPFPCSLLKQIWKYDSLYSQLIITLSHGVYGLSAHASTPWKLFLSKSPMSIICWLSLMVSF